MKEDESLYWYICHEMIRTGFWCHETLFLSQTLWAPLDLSIYLLFPEKNKIDQSIPISTCQQQNSVVFILHVSLVINNLVIKKKKTHFGGRLDVMEWKYGGETGEDQAFERFSHLYKIYKEE